MTSRLQAKPSSFKSPALQWAGLIGLSLGAGGFLAWLGMPAAWFLGPLAAGMALTLGGGRVHVSRAPMALAQALIGCMIAGMLPRPVGTGIAPHGAAFAVGVVGVVLASGLLGWAAARLGVLPGTTVVWGLSPGAATVMTVMAEAHGADTHIVALMQYLRVILVAAIASLIARVVGGGAVHHAAAGVPWFVPLPWLPFAETLALAVAGALFARRFRMATGALLFPLVGGILLTRFGWMTIVLPRWLLGTAYALIGWRIGLRFTKPLLLHAIKTLPRIIGCTLALIAVCGGLAALLVAAAGIDPLTAYLATSPGGADSVAIIAASAHVDVPFVMSMQMVRFFLVLLLGPAMARFIAGRVEAAAKPQPPEYSHELPR